MDCIYSLKKKTTSKIEVGGLNVVFKETIRYKIINNNYSSKKNKKVELYTKTCEKERFKNEVEKLKFFKNNFSGKDKDRFFPLLINVDENELEFTTLGENGFDLYNFIVNNKNIYKYEIENKIETENSIYIFFKLIIQAYKNLYDLKVIHGDITPQNIHINCKNMEDLNENHSIIFLDFETCFYLKDTPTKGGSIYYVPSEVYYGIRDSKTEVFSLGAVFYAILTSHQLVNDNISYNNKKKKEKEKEKYKIEFLKYLNTIKSNIIEIYFAKNKYFKKLIEIMVEKREQRISFDMLIKFFSGDLENFKTQIVNYQSNLNNEKK